MGLHCQPPKTDGALCMARLALSSHFGGSVDSEVPLLLQAEKIW